MQFVLRDEGGNENYGPIETLAKSSDYQEPSDDVVNFASKYYNINQEEARRLLEPTSIVDDAGAWDDKQFVSDLWQAMDSKELPEQTGFKTPNGAVEIDPTKSSFKSADPITRDDSGNVIPLSKRFDVGSRDMRYMPEGENVPNRQKISTKKQPSKLPSRSRIAAVNEDEEQSRRPKRRSTAKGNASAIANAAKLK
jgi:hypothetical protein